MLFWNFEMFLEKRHLWTLVFFLLGVSACGYRFSGSGSLPSDIESVHIAMFKNNSAETGLENIVTNDLIYEFTRKRGSVIQKSDQAEGLLTGVIRSVRADTIARQGQSTSLTRRVVVAVDIKLTDRSGAVLWSQNNVTESEAYNVVADKQTTEQNKKDAILKVSKRLAENLFNRLTEDF
jgi:outer membrane lipopolysaccharide assembly protein LptE/RlpB